jgi:hypothetical protein
MTDNEEKTKYKIQKWHIFNPPCTFEFKRKYINLYANVIFSENNEWLDEYNDL